MLCRAAVIFFTLAFITAALAQDEAPKNSASTALDTASVGSLPGTNMSEVAVGDHWLYRVRDEIAGKLIGIEKVIVIDISGDQVATRVLSTGRSSVMLFDKSWNVLRHGSNRFSPNSGTGIQSPLKLDTEWKAKVDEVNDDNGAAWTIDVNSRVTGDENVTTAAGTFRTYTIETTWVARTVKDPAASRQNSIRTWFSPEVNRWIQRNTVARVDGLVVRNETRELLKYGRKETQ